MKRNILVFLLAALMALSFTACGRRDKNEGMVSQSPTPDTSTVPSTTPSPSASPSPEFSTVPEDDKENSDMPEVSMNGEMKLTDFRDAVKDIYGKGYIPERELSEKEIEELTGITSDMYDEILAEVSSDDTNPDIFIAVKAKEGMGDRVKEKLEVYKTQAGDKFTDEKYTDKLAAARVYQSGDYVFMMLLGDESMWNDMEGTEGETLPEAAGDAVENIGDRLKNAADDAVKAIEDLIG